MATASAQPMSNAHDGPTLKPGAQHQMAQMALDDNTDAKQGAGVAPPTDIYWRGHGDWDTVWKE